jgi:uncharacterized RDD family membrane protein YckC
VHDAPATDTLATIGRRLAARLLDGLVLSPILLVLLAIFGTGPSGATLQLPDAVYRIYWVVAVAYEIGMIALRGQTVGKRWMGIAVVDATTGAVPNLDQSARRAAPVLIQIIPFIGIFGVVFWLTALWRPRRQGLHDSLAATVVVRL